MSVNSTFFWRFTTTNDWVNRCKHCRVKASSHKHIVAWKAEVVASRPVCGKLTSLDYFVSQLNLVCFLQGNGGFSYDPIDVVRLFIGKDSRMSARTVVPCELYFILFFPPPDMWVIFHSRLHLYCFCVKWQGSGLVGHQVQMIISFSTDVFLFCFVFFPLPDIYQVLIIQPCSPSQT